MSLGKSLGPDGIPRISIIKIIVLPLLNFLGSMLPLNPPIGYWDKLHSLIGKFIWNTKKPRIKQPFRGRNQLEAGVFQTSKSIIGLLYCVL